MSAMKLFVDGLLSLELIMPAASRNVGLTPHTEWFLDEVFVKIGGKPMYLWRAVDGEGEVLDVLVQKRRNKRAALKLLRKLL